MLVTLLRCLSPIWDLDSIMLVTIFYIERVYSDVGDDLWILSLNFDVGDIFWIVVFDDNVKRQFSPTSVMKIVRTFFSKSFRFLGYYNFCLSWGIIPWEFDFEILRSSKISQLPQTRFKPKKCPTVKVNVYRLKIIQKRNIRRIEPIQFNFFEAYFRRKRKTPKHIEKTL